MSSLYSLWICLFSVFFILRIQKVTLISVCLNGWFLKKSHMFDSFTSIIWLSVGFSCFPCAVLCCAVLSRSVMSYSLLPHGLKPSLSMGILQPRIPELVAMPSSRESFQPTACTQVSHIAGGLFTVWATREAQDFWSG